MTDKYYLDKLKAIAEQLPATREERTIHEVVAEPWDDGNIFEGCIYEAINLVEEYAREELDNE